MRQLNPAALLSGDFSGFGRPDSSPEVLVQLRDVKVTIRPIAGTPAWQDGGRGQSLGPRPDD